MLILFLFLSLVTVCILPPKVVRVIFNTAFFLQGTMASISEGVAGERRVTMVGPPYLYRGAQVCGRRTSRTCIFLLISFGAALCMIGLVLFTADLAMESGLWAAGVVFMAMGGKREKEFVQF